MRILECVLYRWQLLPGRSEALTCTLARRSFARYILGADPKFKEAPLVLTRAMVDAMGNEYGRFVELAGEAFNILRKSARLLLSVLHVMACSSIADVRSDPDTALLKVQEKLWLHLSDEAAAKAFADLLLSAQSAVLPKLAELQHGLAKTFI